MYHNKLTKFKLWLGYVYAWKYQQIRKMCTEINPAVERYDKALKNAGLFRCVSFHIW